ncbi:MAG: hypothetical protein OHK93_008793 [Ramalina farinacea]|uniref:Uncharacterized protein n=1 Tax=Ramalina farinacea TaxID=258253 RepID=A0AA43QQ61_9LECA|nr:hypothetical protein [Ramalina farinacea]
MVMLFPISFSRPSLAAWLLLAPALINSSPLSVDPRALGGTTGATTPGGTAGSPGDYDNPMDYPGTSSDSSSPSSISSGNTFTVNNTFTISVALSDGTQGITQTYANVNASLNALYTLLTLPNTTHNNLADPVNATASNTMAGFTTKPAPNPMASVYGAGSSSSVPLDVSYPNAAQIMKGLQGWLVGKTVGAVVDFQVMGTTGGGVAQGLPPGVVVAKGFVRGVDPGQNLQEAACVKFGC